MRKRNHVAPGKQSMADAEGGGRAARLRAHRPEARHRCRVFTGQAKRTSDSIRPAASAAPWGGMARVRVSELESDKRPAPYEGHKKPWSLSCEVDGGHLQPRRGAAHAGEEVAGPGAGLRPPSLSLSLSIYIYIHLI